MIYIVLKQISISVVHMKSRIEDKEKAIDMRKRGYTQTEIVSATGASKASVSGWVKDVQVPGWYKSHVSKIRSDNILRIKPRRKPKVLPTIGGILYRQCNNCKQSKRHDQFPKTQSRKSSWCIECVRNYNKMHHKVMRLCAITHLGGTSCGNGCGCNITDMLEIHHVDVDGHIERGEISTMIAYKKICGMPIEQAIQKYKVLCYVCHKAIHAMIKHPEIKYILTTVRVPELAREPSQTRS
jgi:hypothetical protein